MPEPILIAQNLRKEYGSLAAVKNLSFEIYENEIFSLLGPNGAGKTTSISMLSTLLPPTSGTASINGFNIQSNSIDARKQIGVVPQEIALYEDLTGLENLLFWGTMYDLSGKSLKNRADEILERIGLTEKANKKVKTYSGGMKRRLNIGAGLLHKPKLIFMDEPTVGIDPQSRRSILDMVKELNRLGMSVLYTTHYMEEAQELSHRVGIIDHGEMIAIGSQQQLIQQIGENETLRLHLRPGQVLPPGLIPSLEASPNIVRASYDADQVIVNVSDAESCVAEVISVVHQYEIQISSVDIEEPNLESVFLHLTGRMLRD